jgi:uncharacterized protein (TIGR02594 family)
MPGQIISPLDTMKSIVGTSWSPHDGPSPTIGTWLNFIGNRYPNMESYCSSVLHMEYFQWCGLTVAYCMAKANIAPVFGTVDVARFLWAEAWLKWGKAVSTPVAGDVVVFNFGGGDQHVTLFSAEGENSRWACLGGNQSHRVQLSDFPKSNVIGIRRSNGAGSVGAPSAAPSVSAPSAPGAGPDDPSVPNKYKDFPVDAYSRTTLTATDIAARLASMDVDTNIKRAAYALICNESGSGRAGINNNYGGLQADVGRWSSEYDEYISGTCVEIDISGAKRRFLCFANADGCFKMIVGLIQKRALYIGATTNFITHMHITSPSDWALAYFREWVKGDANATLSEGELRNLLGLYGSAVTALP